MKKNIPAKVIIDTLREHGNNGRVGDRVNNYIETHSAAQLAADRLEETMALLQHLLDNTKDYDGWTIENLIRFGQMRGDSR